MHKQKACINMLPRSKATKSQQIAVADLREKPEDYFNSTARTSMLALAKTFANFGSLAKVSLPVQSSIPWVHTMVVGVCNTMISNACTQPQLPLSNESLGLLEYKNY